MKVSVKSAGIKAGNMCKINVLGKEVKILKSEKSKSRRGMNLVVVNPNNGKIFLAKAFDTLLTSAPLESALNSIPFGFIIAIGIKDEGTRRLSSKVKRFFKDIGSTEIDKIKYRGSWAFIGLKGGRDATEQRGKTLGNKAFAKRTLEGELMEGQAGFSITMLSAGIRAGNFANMIANGKTFDLRKRGISMFVLDPNTGKLIS